MENIFLSVIIPTRNRANMLKGTLESIAKQNLPQQCFETIVVDNGSTDKTKKAAKSFIDKIPNLRYFYEETPGLHVGRHKGLKEAKADILVYADDDIEAFPTWLETIAEAFEDKDVVLAGGKVLPKFESKPPEWLMKMWVKKKSDKKVLGSLSIIDLGDEIREISPYYVFGCNFAIRKSILLETGGFHPDGMPRELIRYRGDGESYVSGYILKKGYKTIYYPEASVYHHVPESRMAFGYFYQRAFADGISNSYKLIRTQKGVNSKLYFQKLLHKLKFHVKNRFKRCVNGADKLQEHIGKGYWDGFDFHQREVKNNQRLLEWILKNSYLDS